MPCAQIFDPIAVQWTRGAHQAVSVSILAMALGAQPLGGGEGGCSPAAALRRVRSMLSGASAAGLRASHEPTVALESPIGLVKNPMGSGNYSSSRNVGVRSKETPAETGKRELSRGSMVQLLLADTTWAAAASCSSQRRCCHDFRRKTVIKCRIPTFFHKSHRQIFLQ